MSPNIFGTSAALYLEASQQNVHKDISSTGKSSRQELLVQKSQKQATKYEWQIVWRNVIAFATLHLAALYAIYLFLTSMKIVTFIYAHVFGYICGLGITGGAHRLWAHRSYKAKWPMRLLLMIFQTIAFQNHIYEWVRDHRTHHKFTDTDADPHNAQRGFFFSHMGWLLVRKHPDVVKKGATIDMSDLDQDQIVIWQRRLYPLLVPLFCFVIPTLIPIYFWNETPMNAWYACCYRYAWTLHMTWLVNSAAHIWGMKPYDKSISPTDHFVVAIAAVGEGWHNYHHVYPWDYKAAELGNYKYNYTTAFIDMFAQLGQAYDLKTVPIENVKKRAQRTGDGSKYPFEQGHHSHEGAKWGWGDVDMEPEEMGEVEIINKSDCVYIQECWINKKIFLMISQNILYMYIWKF